MNWLGFFSLGSAWLALLLVPLVLVYFLKLRRPRQSVSSLALWYQVINDQRVNSPFQKFKRNLLLLLQVLVLVCLVLAAMQPFLPRASVRAQYQPILIDCSASMGALDAPGGRATVGRGEETGPDDRSTISSPISGSRSWPSARRPGGSPISPTTKRS